VNRVHYAFAHLNSDGTLRSLDEHVDHFIPADGEKGCLAALAKLKDEYSAPMQQQKRNQNPRLETLLAVGGGGSQRNNASFSNVASNPQHLSTFASSVRSFVDSHNLDGVDIDWEHPETVSDGKLYISLLTSLRSALPRPKYLLASALPSGLYCLKHIDLSAAAGLLDSLNLMGYDFAGPWTKVSGHHAQLHQPTNSSVQNSGCSVAQGVEYLLSHDFPAHKIILGIPAYARSFAGASGPGEPFTGTEEIEYRDLPREWVRDVTIDRKLCVASYVDEEGKGFVSFDVPETVRIKAEYVRQKGLGGLFYWTGVGDVKDGPESLVRAGWEALT
jgi:chitinase